MDNAPSAEDEKHTTEECVKLLAALTNGNKVCAIIILTLIYIYIFLNDLLVYFWDHVP